MARRRAAVRHRGSTPLPARRFFAFGGVYAADVGASARHGRLAAGRGVLRRPTAPDGWFSSVPGPGGLGLPGPPVSGYPALTFSLVGGSPRRDRRSLGPSVGPGPAARPARASSRGNKRIGCPMPRSCPIRACSAPPRTGARFRHLFCRLGVARVPVGLSGFGTRARPGSRSAGRSGSLDAGTVLHWHFELEVKTRPAADPGHPRSVSQPATVPVTEHQTVIPGH